MLSALFRMRQDSAGANWGVWPGELWALVVHYKSIWGVRLCSETGPACRRLIEISHVLLGLSNRSPRTRLCLCHVLQRRNRSWRLRSQPIDCRRTLMAATGTKLQVKRFPSFSHTSNGLVTHMHFIGLNM